MDTFHHQTLAILLLGAAGKDRTNQVDSKEYLIKYFMLYNANIIEGKYRRNTII